jgi:hypothetical protein
MERLFVTVDDSVYGAFLRHAIMSFASIREFVKRASRWRLCSMQNDKFSGRAYFTLRVSRTAITVGSLYREKFKRQQNSSAQNA